MKPSFIKIMLVAALALAASTFATFAQPFAPFQTQTNGPAFVPGEVLVKFKANASDDQLQDFVLRAGISASKHIQTRSMRDRGDDGIERTTTGRNVADLLRELKNHPAVEHAQPNWIYYHQAEDPYYVSGNLWGICGMNTVPSSEFGSGAAAVWDAVTGTEPVYVGIIDEGIQYNHPDLTANMWVNKTEVAGNRKDDDVNGYVDDIYGWNAINNNGTIYNSLYDDHGTHVAGTIGATANTVGVVGMVGNENVKFISGKFLGPNGGTTTDAIEAIDYMIALKEHNGLNIVALNNSWGGGGYDPLLLNSIVRAATAKILFVVAAGNGDSSGVAINTDANPSYPSCYDTTTQVGYNSVISVTAIDKFGAMPVWANYGKTTVDLAAPGVDILSTLNNSTYGYASGTSMATPHVTGAIALYALNNPTATPSEIREALMNSAAPTPSTEGKTVTGGRLDVPNMLFPPADAPTAPTGLTAAQISGATKVALTWTDKSDNETSFKIKRSGVKSDGSAIAETTTTVPGNTASYTDAGLIPNATYTYSIAACNSKGLSDYTGPVAVTIQGIAEAAASPKADDVVTKGSWVGVYGIQGYDIISYKKMPVGVTMNTAALVNIWAATTTDVRGLQTPDKSSRSARCYYSTPVLQPVSFDVDVNLDDKATHRVALYCMDWDSTLRNQMIEVIDYNYNNVLSTRTISGFNGGLYLVWEIKGHVTFRFTNIYTDSIKSGNAVVSGIFIDDPTYAPPTIPAAPSSLTVSSTITAQVNLAWKDNSGNEDGFIVQRSTKSNSGFATVGSVAKDLVAYVDKSGLRSGTTYYYRVYSYNTAGNSSGYASSSIKAK